MPNLNTLFIYGTLAPNRPNHHIMTPIKNGEWLPAYTFGNLIPNGWGAVLGYPALIPNPNGDKIDGFIFKSNDLINHWDRLDEFEGDGYNRIEITAYLENHTPITAYVYALANHEIENFNSNHSSK